MSKPMELDPVMAQRLPHESARAFITAEPRRLGRKKAFDYRDDDYLASAHIAGLQVRRRATVQYRRKIDVRKLSDDAHRELVDVGLRLAAKTLAVDIPEWARGIPDENLITYFPRTPKLQRIDQEGSTCVSAGHVNAVEMGRLRQQIEPLIKPFGFVDGPGSSPAVYRFIRHGYDWMQRNDEWEGEEDEGIFGTSERAGAQFFRKCGFWPNFFWLREPEQVFLTICGEETQSVVGIGSDWTTGMDKPDSKGFIHPTGAWRGGHFYLFDGANIILQKVRPLNSWGYQAPYYLAMKGLRSLMGWGAGVLYYLERRVQAISLPE